MARPQVCRPLLTVLGPPVLSDPALLPNAGFRMFLRGSRNASYTLEKSGNLSNWTSWGAVTYTNGLMPITDETATNGIHWFYRVRQIVPEAE